MPGYPEFRPATLPRRDNDASLGKRREMEAVSPNPISSRDPDVLLTILIAAALVIYQLCRKHRLLRPHSLGARAAFPPGAQEYRP
jgi:hypothetical protein